MTGRPKRPTKTDRYRYVAKVRLRVHKLDDIKRVHPTWDTMSRREKMEALRTVTPLYEEEQTNITTENLIRHIHDKLDGQVVDDVDTYAIGSGTTPPTIMDADLDTRENTQLITTVTDSGLTLETSTFWDTTEANGITFAEGGLLAGGTTGTPGSGGVLLARVVFASAQVKDATKTFTVDHDLTGTPG